MSRSDVIRNAIRQNPGITHEDIVSKVSASQHPADIKKAELLLTYVLRLGGFEVTRDFRVGSSSPAKRYYTTQAYNERLEKAKQTVENTIPTLEQHHDAHPITKQTGEIMQHNQEQSGAIIEIKFEIQLPEMPTQLKLTGLKKSSLDDAIATGSDGYTIDVATLDDNAVESLCAQWAQKFKAHVQQRRNSN